MAHKHSVYDTDAHFQINPITRAIKNVAESKVAVIQHDHNSERFTFEIPRRVDGHDMSLCDRVEIHYINMDSTNKENISADIYEVNDLQVSPDDSGIVICSWLLSQNATKHAGSLNFLVRFVCLDGEKVAYAWHTGVFTGISVSSGILNNAEEIVEPYVDVLAQWKAQIFAAGDSAVLVVDAAKEEALEAIEAKKAAVLDSIPDEYEALQAQADGNTRNKAGAIVLDAEGESIALSDSSEYPLQNLKVFGKSTQDGTPTPDAPVDIVSVESPTVTIDEQSIVLSHTLPGIPVTSSGNYTDENGQQWICDEVDLARGVYVRRVNPVVFTGADDETFSLANEKENTIVFLVLLPKNQLEANRDNFFSNRFVQYVPDNDAEKIVPNVNSIYIALNKERLSEPSVNAFRAWLVNNNVTMHYVLSIPEEIPLSETELAAWRSLHTNKPNTTILNDAGAHMAVEYVADTKTYIDRKIAEMVAANSN